MGWFTKNNASAYMNPFDVDINSLPPFEKYEKLEEYYNNTQYSNVSYYAYKNDKWVESAKPLRNPVYKAVEFYTAKLLPGSTLEVVCQKDTVKAAVEQIHKWSNINENKEIFARNLALYGDLFLKATIEDGKAYIESIPAKYVTSFKQNKRGYLDEIRIDIPMVDEDTERSYTYVEYWTKEYFSIWKDYQGNGTPLDQLGDPISAGFTSEFGIDFVPFVYVRFSALDSTSRGKSCVDHCLSKVDEANRMVTRLHQMLYRYNSGFWLEKNTRIDPKTGKASLPPLTNDKNLSLGDNDIIYTSGDIELTCLVPDINYADALSILNAQLEEISNDLPEVKWFEVKDGSISGKALKLILQPAIEKANRAQSNLVAGLVRIDEMLLTMGISAGIFRNIGKYQTGDFEHSFNLPPMFPLDLEDKATIIKSLTDAGLPLSSALKAVGYTQEQIDEILQAKLDEQSSQSNALASALVNKFNAE